jgi:hypothetical protein
MRLVRLAAVTSAVPMLIGALTPPANAVTFVDVSAKDLVVRYDDCKKTPVSVSGNWNADTYNEVRVTVRGPGGRLVTSRTFYDDADGSVQMSARLCNGDKQGTYGVAVVAIGYDETMTETSRADGSTTFEYDHIAKARSNIRHKVVYDASRPTYKWIAGGRLLRKGRGYSDARIILASRIGGDWYKIDAARTSRRGYFAWKFKKNNLAWRFYFLGDRKTKSIRTQTFHTSSGADARTDASVDAAKAFVAPH